KNVEARVDGEISRASDFALLGPNAEAEKAKIRKKLAEDLYKNVQMDYRTVPPLEQRDFVFSNLADAKKSDRPLLLRYKVQAGTNSPDQTYKIPFEFMAGASTVREVPLNQIVTLPLFTSAIDKDGNLPFRVTNGDIFQRRPNAEAMMFPMAD